MKKEAINRTTHDPTLYHRIRQYKLGSNLTALKQIHDINEENDWKYKIGV